MTIEILQNQADFTFAIDTPNIVGDVELEIFSPYSNTVLVTLTGIFIEANDRFSRFLVAVPQDFWDKHYSGMYTYKVYSGTVIYDEGALKLITQPGGGMGTMNHISTNENRQSEVVYRPNY
jgi:hypothetical protein